jgi:sulfur-oxidizing protein SoxY
VTKPGAAGNARHPHMSDTMTTTVENGALTRRSVLVTLAGAGVVAAVRVVPARATPASMKEAIRKVVGEAGLKTGRVQIDVPVLVDNGNTVPLTVEVESPMTAADHVKAIHVFNELNPLPNVISAYLGPRSGRARLATRFRLADTQTVVAVAEMSDGTFHSATADVVVTMQACLETL